MTGGIGGVYTRAAGSAADKTQAQTLLSTTLGRSKTAALDFVSVTTWCD